MRAIASVVRTVLLGCNLMTILLLWIIAACQWVSPDFASLAGVLCLTFPIMVVANALFVVVWLMIHPRYVAVPLVGMLMVGGSISSYCPLFNAQSEDTGHTLKAVTYNVHMWSKDNAVENDTNRLVQWICDQQADIVLVQEAVNYDDIYQQLQDAGYQINKYDSKGSVLCILTRDMEVMESDSVPLLSKTNKAMYTRMRMANGDTLVVVNVHLESFGLNDDDKGEYRDVVRNLTSDSAHYRSRALVGKMRPILAMHGQQADSLRTFIQRQLQAGYRVIVGGDFNDVPNSYAASKVRSVLTDCFRKGGRGPGFTFSEQLMYFRIDHFFCDERFDVNRTYVDKKASWSDHYPLVTHLSY